MTRFFAPRSYRVPALLVTAVLGILNLPAWPASPQWKVQVVIYDSVDFQYTDSMGQPHHVTTQMTAAEKSATVNAATTFFGADVLALNSGAMSPIATVGFASHSLTQLAPIGACPNQGYWPDPASTAPDLSQSFDSTVVIWKEFGLDSVTGQAVNLACYGGLTWNQGTSQTYSSFTLESIGPDDRNVFKHEWGHAIVFYYDAVGNSPKPVVDNHINNTTNPYVHCGTATPYVLVDETNSNPIPDSIYNDNSGFTHDYYSGTTATPDQPSRCLGITPQAWADGGPFSRPLPRPPGVGSSRTTLNPDGTETFQVQYGTSSRNRSSAFLHAYVLFGPALQLNNVCLILWDRTTGISLFNDAGTGVVTGSPTFSGILQNSQCQVLSFGTFPVTSLLTLIVTVQFSNTFGNLQRVFSWVADDTGQNSGWNALGTTLPPVNTPPTVLSGVANSDHSPGYTFSYSGVNGYGYLSAAYALINSTLNASNGCMLLYSAPYLYLFNDAGTGMVTGAVTPGTVGTLSNSQCTLNGIGTSVNGAGPTLTMELALTYSGAFATNSLLTLYGYASDGTGLNSGWKNLSIPSSPQATAPTADSVTGMVNNGLNQSLTFQFSSVNTYHWLRGVYMLLGPSLTGAGACLAEYDASSNVFYLFNDAGSAVSGSLNLGSAGTLQNSQCILKGIGSSVTGSGNTLTVVLNMTLSAAFGGVQQIWMYALDANGLASGWQNKGTTASGSLPTADTFTGFNPGANTQTLTFQYSSANGASYLT